MRHNGLESASEAKRAITRALRAGRRLKAVVVGSALDGERRTLGTARRTIRLKR